MMNKNLSQTYSLQSETNDSFFMKGRYMDRDKFCNMPYVYDSEFRTSFSKNHKEISRVDYTFSSLKNNVYENISGKDIYSFFIPFKSQKSPISSNKLYINSETSNFNHHSSHLYSSTYIKGMPELNEKMQGSPQFFHKLETCENWKQSSNLLDQLHDEKSNFPHYLKLFDSYIPEKSPKNTYNSFLKDINASLKSPLDCFNNSSVFLNSSILSKNSFGKSFKCEDIFSDFYATELKTFSKRKKYPLLKNHQKKSISLLHASTIYLISVFKACNPKFNYELSRNPKRALTKPSKGIKNDGYDNEDNDYILHVNDILGSNRGHRYLILDILGQGTFGQVVKCRNIHTQEIVAVKVIKNKPAYFNQSMTEITILDLLNKKLDKSRKHNILQLKDTFIHKKHLCIVSELLSVNLYELIKQNQFKGLNTNLVRTFATQILDAMIVLSEEKIIHCDLKPENILLNNLESPVVKIIDFGSACYERQTVYTYIQSRFYRSPEVLLGLPYSSSIDVWSFGCIIAELFLGLPLFPGTSEYNQVFRIVEMLGMPPAWMIEMGKQSKDFFEKIIDNTGHKIYCLKTMEQYEKEHNTTETPNKRYFSASTLPEIIKTYPIQKKFVKSLDMDKEIILRNALVDFLISLLNINPLQRLSPQQAKMHPFITGNELTKKLPSRIDLKSFFNFPENTSNINHFNTLSDSHEHSKKIIDNPKACSMSRTNSTRKNSYIYNNIEARNSLRFFQSHKNPLYLSTSVNIHNPSQQSNKQKEIHYVSPQIPPECVQRYTYVSNIPHQIYQTNYFSGLSQHSSLNMFQNYHTLSFKYPPKASYKGEETFYSF